MNTGSVEAERVMRRKGADTIRVQVNKRHLIKTEYMTASLS